MSKPKFKWYVGMKVTPDFSSQEELDNQGLQLTLGKQYTVIGDDAHYVDTCIYVIADDGKKFGFYWYRFRPASLDDMVEL